MLVVLVLFRRGLASVLPFPTSGHIKYTRGRTPERVISVSRIDQSSILVSESDRSAAETTEMIGDGNKGGYTASRRST